MTGIVRFLLGSLAVTVFAIAALWIFGGFSGLGLSTDGMIALSLGIIFTVLVGVGLMALIFYGEGRE